MMANRALTSIALWLAVASAAQAQLFGGDDEARRAIIDLRGRIDLMSRELGAQMKEYADRLDALEAATRGQLALRSELDAMRQELARLRGSLEEQTNELANTQKMLRDQSAEFSERLRPIEPVAVQIDGKSVTVSPSERRRFEAAVTAFRERDFKLAQSTLQSFRTQYPDSPYMANVLFWLGSTYPLVIGLAATLADRREQDLALRATGYALLLLMFVGLLLIPIMPTLVLDRQYGQGWLPGLPRFGGLATHPVSMGLLAQLGLLCLLARPLPKVWLNRAAWLMGLAVLFMAQSKTAWLAFVLCTAAVLVVRGWPHWQAQLGRVQQPTPALLVLGLALLGIAGALLLLVMGDPGGRLDRFLLSPEGSQLSAMTGRDRIWAIAWQEWQIHPWFGWGLPIWDDAYRRAIGMNHATHAHNQLMDTLSRSGLVGAAALLGYTVVLGVLALRHARATQGLSVALLLALLLRAGSEVPLLLMGYGPDLIAHLLLLMTLAAQSAGRAAEPSRPRSAGSAAPAAPHGQAGLGAATGRWLTPTGPRRP